MAETDLSIVMRARDEATRSLQSVQNAVNSLGGHINTTGRRAGGLSSAFGGLGSVLGNVTQMAAGFATGMIALNAIQMPVQWGKQALDIAMDYESAMNMLQAVTGATGEQMEAMGRMAKDLGKDMSLPATSAKDAAEAMKELAKSGLSVNDVMSAAKGTLALAAAANVTEAQAAEIASNALNAFGLAGTEANRIADLLAASANASSAEITDMADALKMSAAVFASAGFSIDELSAALGEMANKGIKGSDAGTSLKQMILSLQAPSKEAKRLMNEMGIAVYDAAGQMRPFRDLIQQFTGATSNMTQQQKDYALATIFGSDAVRAANVVLAGGVEAYDKMYKAVTKQGAAAELAGARMKGLAGAIEGLKSQIETIMLEAAGPFLGTLEEWVRWGADKVPAAFEAMRAAVVAVVKDVQGFVEQLRPLGEQVMPLLAQALAIASEHWDAFKGALIAIAAVLGGAGIAALIGAIVGVIVSINAPILALVALAAILGAAWSENWGDIQGKTAAVIEFLSALFNAALNRWQEWWSSHGDSVMTILSAFWENQKRGWQTIAAIIGAVIKRVTELWEENSDWIMKIWQTVWNNLKRVSDLFFQTFGNALDAFAAAMEGDWYRFGQELREMWNDAWNTIGNIFRASGALLVQLAGEIAQAVWDKVTNTDWPAVGRAIIEGFIKGVNEKWNDFINTIRALVSAAWDVVKGFFGISSPSKLMAKAGKQIVEGLTLGINTGKYQPSAAMESVMKPVATVVRNNTTNGSTVNNSSRVSNQGDTIVVQSQAAASMIVNSKRDARIRQLVEAF